MANKNPELSIIVTTRNEEANIANCLIPFAALRDKGIVELLVIDNASRDATCELAIANGAKVFQQGPERSAQRNRGAREAKADFLMFLDADMIVGELAITEILSRIARNDFDALYVRESRTGEGLRARARNFERGFYDATCIDMVRVVRRELFLAIGGFDEELTGPEDWDFDRRVNEKTSRVFLTHSSLVHNEKQLSLRDVLKKKAYYSASFPKYQEKWNHDAIIKKQFGFYYRFIGVFVEKGKWKRILRHPILFATMMFERVLVGFVYLANREKKN